MPSEQHKTLYTKDTVTHGMKTAGAALLQIVVPFEVPQAYDQHSTIRLCQVPSNFVIVKGAITSAGLSTDLTANLGLYETAEDGGAEVDDDLFITGGAALNTAGSYPIDQIAVADQGKAVWELADGVDDYDCDSSKRQAFDVVLKVVASGDTADEKCVFKMLLARKS